MRIISFVVFDEDDGVCSSLAGVYFGGGQAVVFKFLHRALHQQYVVVVESDAGFVEDVHDVGEWRVDVFGYATALSLSAAE